MVFSIRDKNQDEVLVTNCRKPTILEMERGIREVIDRVIIRFEATRAHTFVDQCIVYDNGSVEENVIN